MMMLIPNKLNMTNLIISLLFFAIAFILEWYYLKTNNRKRWAQFFRLTPGILASTSLGTFVNTEFEFNQIVSTILIYLCYRMINYFYVKRLEQFYKIQ